MEQAELNTKDLQLFLDKIRNSRRETEPTCDVCNNLSMFGRCICPQPNVMYVSSMFDERNKELFAPYRKQK